MGCDIHMIAQVKNNGEWKTEAEDIYTNRFYELFNILGDGRERGYAIYPIRGFPKDLELDDDNYTKNGFWLGDFNFSWITVSELLQSKIFMALVTDSESLQKLMSFLNSLGEPENVRIVFGFDN